MSARPEFGEAHHPEYLQSKPIGRARRMATAATKFRIDASIHNLLQDSNEKKPLPVEPKGLTLPTPVFPQYPD
jgi:hypothetical protein